MTINVPAGVPAEGSVFVQWVTTIADTSAMTLAEVNASSSLALACYITEQNFKPNADDATGTDPRLCSKQVFETLGAATWSIDNIVYVLDPQNPSSDGNKAYSTLKRGTSGFLVVRWGKDIEDNPTLASGDIVDIFPVTLGSQVKQPPEANSVLKCSQKPVVTGPVVEDYALPAA